MHALAGDSCPSALPRLPIIRPSRPDEVGGVKELCKGRTGRSYTTLLSEHHGGNIL